jgi:hypothetical protein
MWAACLRRGCSSDGRALQSHCRGQGFDSPQLHQPSSNETNHLQNKVNPNRRTKRPFGIALVSQLIAEPAKLALLISGSYVRALVPPPTTHKAERKIAP